MSKANTFYCPNCRLALKKSTIYKCSSCKLSFSVDSNIPLLFSPNEDWGISQKDVTEVVKQFYEKTPFPNYEGIDSVWTLREKAERGIYIKLLNEQISKKATILEAGCGTGQLSNILGSHWNRNVFGADMCLNSLKLGESFRKKNKISNTTFVQMNIFKPIFKDESFDYVISNGVLHHTSNPYLAFQTLARLVKKGGYIIIGLYNTYGRLPTDIRRILYRRIGSNNSFGDQYLSDRNMNKVKKNTWFMDQYMHPHESKHTIDEVLRWFNKNDIKFVNGIPKPSYSNQFSDKENLFENNKEGNLIEHMLIQLGMIFNPSNEGGFFVMIGRKN